MGEATELVGSGGYFPEDARDVMAIMGSRRWDMASIVTHVFPLERITDARERPRRLAQREHHASTATPT